MISFSPVWVKLVSVSPTTSGFYRVLFGGVALTLFLIFTRQRLHLSKRVWLVLLLSSVFFALDLWFWHRSINYIGPGLSTLLANFQVFFMMLAGVLMLGQRPRPIQIVAVPLALVGLGMIVGFDWQSLPADYRLGVVFGLLTAVAYAGYMLTMRSARTNAVHPLPTREVAIISIGSAVILGLSATVEGVSLAIPTLSDATWLLAYRPGSTSATNLEFRVGRGVFRPPDDSAGTRWCCDRTGRNLSRVTSQSRLKQLESVRQDVYIKPLSGFPYLTIKMGRHCFGSHDR